MKRCYWLVPFVVVVCLMSAGLAAQQGTADIRGRVVDQQGAVLPGVTVIVRNQDSGMFREAVTGAGRPVPDERHDTGHL